MSVTYEELKRGLKRVMVERLVAEMDRISDMTSEERCAYLAEAPKDDTEAQKAATLRLAIAYAEFDKAHEGQKQ